MFDDIDYCTKIESRVLKLLFGALIMTKGSKIYGLYILNGYIVIVHALLASQVFHNKSQEKSFDIWACK